MFLAAKHRLGLGVPKVHLALRLEKFDFRLGYPCYLTDSKLVEYIVEAEIIDGCVGIVHTPIVL